MNKPATKEPSMDEILSSIRQIIADDDASVAPRNPQTFADSEFSDDDAFYDVGAEVPESEPLALSPSQIMRPTPVAEPEAEPEDEAEVAEFAALLSDPADREEAPVEPVAASTPESSTDFFDAEDVTFDAEPPAVPHAPAPASVAPSAPQRPRPTPAQAAPMPDPTLSADMAEELLEPATNAAVRANFARLSNLGLGTPGLTIEAMMREMLRPMLKDWLDEHLPMLVERMVEKEIARISRGVD